MHSSLNRLQAVFGFFTTVALFVAGFAALSVLLYPGDDATAQVSLKDVKVIKGRPHYYSTKKEEYAQMRFDLDADLSPFFNWNTKQLFVYVYASYSSSDNPSSTSALNSESIIWDTIIEAPTSPYSLSALKERFLSKSSKKSSKRTTAASKKKAGAASAEPGVLRLRGQKSKYQLSDITGRLAERKNVTLNVGWNVQPWVGALWWSPRSGAAVQRTLGEAAQSEPFDFPPLKTKKVEGAGSK